MHPYTFIWRPPTHGLHSSQGGSRAQDILVTEAGRFLPLLPDIALPLPGGGQYNRLSQDSEDDGRGKGGRRAGGDGGGGGGGEGGEGDGELAG